LLEDYKKDLNERNIQPLSDDYIKFIRLAQYYIEKNGEGIIAYICNNSFIDGLIHRQMRKELMRAFDKIYILDLHGNTRKEEVAPDGSKDGNVFDIMQGVSVNIFIKTKDSSSTNAQIYHYELYGAREFKYQFLQENSLHSIQWNQLIPQTPQFFFVPKNFALQEEYEKYFSVDVLMPTKTVGVATYDDGNLISQAPYDNPCNQPYLYRPFDMRWINYDLQKVSRHRYEVMCHFVEKSNLGLIAIRNNRDNSDTYFVTKGLADKTVISPKDNASVFPLYIYKVNMGEEERIVNFNKDLYAKIAKGLNYLPCYDDNVLVDPTSEYNGVLYPQDLFDYIYAVLHCPAYRERYKEFLKIDFPRIPYPTNWEKFRDLAEKGEELRQLHLMEDIPNSTGVSFPQAGSLQVDCYRWTDNRVYINSEQYFEGVPESAWNFYIGGYQPAQKWLKDRKGMMLSFEDVKHYQHIIYILQQTEQLMQEIDVIMAE